MSSIESLLKSELKNEEFDALAFINSSTFGERPAELLEVVVQLLKAYRDNHLRNRNDLGLSITVEKIQQLAPSLENLDKRLQKHIQMLRQNECSLSGTNTVLEYDSAKMKADKLMEILRAKKTWSDVYEKIMLLEPTDRDLRFQQLLKLQKSFDVLHRYAPKNSEREHNFERLKDEFFSWFSPATVIAIDTNDVKHIEALHEKYAALNRLPVFEQIFGSYARNKIRCYLEDEKVVDRSLWSVLHEVFGIWKRCHSLSRAVVDEDGSRQIADNLLDGLTQKWNIVATLVGEAIAFADTPFKAAREIGKMCSDFLSYVEFEGDSAIHEVCSGICRRIFAALGDDYGKHVTSVLLCVINRITIQDSGARGRYEWLLAHIDEIHFCMRGIVDEARTTFSADFAQQILPSFEKGVRELNSLLVHQNVFNIKSRRADSKTAAGGGHESIDDKISAICITGSILNVIDRIDDHIAACLSEHNVTSHDARIANRGILEKLNRKVVARKIDSITQAIIQTMSAEMVKLKLAASTSRLDADMKISLPSFSVVPQNYITNVGHELLNVMNTISAYGSNRNFIVAIISIAGKGYNEEEADLWVITEIGTRVMEAFCDNVGSIPLLNVELARQFHTDIVFLMEALIDLRLQPTARLVDCAKKMKEILEEKEKTSSA